MRILKRNLAFVMVLAMALGMMVTASAANVEDYKDANDITFVEAVDTLTALGILEGEDGTFNPQNTLTREQGAKIIAYLMLGKDAADNLKTSYAPFNDVAADRWSAGFVAYCVSQNIVGGYGNGNFGPNDTLTGTQFAKMLLCALGYGVNGEFTGTNWEIETNKQALTAGMFDGNLGANFTAGVKREEAALYAFNTLTDIMTVSYSDVFGDYYSGQMFKDIDEADEYKYTLGYTLYSLEKKTVTGGDDFGRPCHTWKAGAKNLGGNFADEPDAVYTKSVKSSQMYEDLGLTELVKATVKNDGADGDGSTTATTFYINKTMKEGHTVAADETDGTGGTSTNLSTGSSVANKGLGVGKGVIVEAYVGETGTGLAKKNTVTLVVVHTYLAQVTNYDAADNEVTVNILDGTNPSDCTFETAVEYEEDDYVMVTVAKDKIQSVKPVTTVQGKLEAVSTNYIKFEGEQYDKAALNVGFATSDDVEGTDINYDSTYDLVVDDAGYAVALILVEEGDEDVAGYIYLKKTQGRENNLLNGSAAVAEVTYLDGTGTETLPLETANKTVDGESTLCFKFIGSLSEAIDTHVANWYKVADLNDEHGNADDKFAGFYRYSINSDGELVLKELDAKAVDSVTGAKEFDGTTTFDTSFRLNNNTVMKVIDKDDKLTTLSGYKNIKIETEAGDAILIIKSSDTSNLAKEIYVMSDAAAKSDEVFAYYMGKAADFEETADGNMIRLYVDGEAQWYYTDEWTDYNAPKTLSGVAEGADDHSTWAAGVYLIEVDNDNNVEMKSAEHEDAANDNYSYEKDVVVTDRVDGGFVGGGNTYIYADTHNVYGVYDGFDSLTNVTKNNKVIVIENDKEEVTHVFVTAKEV